VQLELDFTSSILITPLILWVSPSIIAALILIFPSLCICDPIPALKTLSSSSDTAKQPSLTLNVFLNSHRNLTICSKASCLATFVSRLVEDSEKKPPCIISFIIFLFQIAI
jgi:hypothetical protein